MKPLKTYLFLSAILFCSANFVHAMNLPFRQGHLVKFLRGVKKVGSFRLAVADKKMRPPFEHYYVSADIKKGPFPHHYMYVRSSSDAREFIRNTRETSNVRERSEIYVTPGLAQQALEQQLQHNLKNDYTPQWEEYDCDVYALPIEVVDFDNDLNDKDSDEE